MRTALLADSSSANDSSFLTNSVPASSPFTASIAMTHANARALGLAAGTNGVDTSGFTCFGINGTTCFDAVITVSSAQFNAGHFWFRTVFGGGPQGGLQYDFFSIVYHETDEVLGATSLCCGQNPGLFKYQIWPATTAMERGATAMARMSVAQPLAPLTLVFLWMGARLLLYSTTMPTTAGMRVISLPIAHTCRMLRLVRGQYWCITILQWSSFFSI